MDENKDEIFISEEHVVELYNKLVLTHTEDTIDFDSFLSGTIKLAWLDKKRLLYLKLFLDDRLFEKFCNYFEYKKYINFLVPSAGTLSSFYSNNIYTEKRFKYKNETGFLKKCYSYILKEKLSKYILE